MRAMILFVVAFFLSIPASSDPNPNISNGTCYYMDGEQAPAEFIPCGNAAIGHVTCCAAGDNCLADSACYGSGGVTYVAGCTDQNYDDQICPTKAVDYQDREWVGLFYCGRNGWGACNNTGSTVEMQLGCTCSGPIAFTDTSVLSNIMSLPTKAGKSVSWFPPYGAENAYTGALVISGSSGRSSSRSAGPTNSPNTPTATTSDSSTSTSSDNNQDSITPLPSQSTSTSSSSSSSDSNSPNNPPPDSPGPENAPPATPAPLSSPAKVGIGIGASAGFLLAAALLYLALTRLRTRKTNRVSSPIDHQIRPRSDPDSGTPTEKTAAAAHNFDDPRSPTWSGHKSELPADNSFIVSPPTSGHGWERPQSQELQGSSVRSSNVYGGGGSTVSGQTRTSASATYIPYSRPIAEEAERQGSPRAGGVGRPVAPGIYEMPG